MSENKRERGIRTPNYQYVGEGIWTAANSGQFYQAAGRAWSTSPTNAENENINVIKRQLSEI